MIRLRDIPKRNAEKYPDKTAVVFGNTRYTFRELNDRINSLANALSNMGLGKGDRLAIMADSCHQYADILWTAVKMGMAITILNPASSQQELSYLVNNAGARAILVGQSYCELAESLRPQLRSVSEYIIIPTSYEELISSSSPLEPEAKVSDDDLLILGCSSGTTGMPKQVMHTHSSSLAQSLGMLEGYSMSENDVNLLATPVFWGLTQIVALIYSGYFGCTAIIAGELTPQSILAIIEKERVTTIFTGAPSIPGLTEQAQLGKYNHASLRCALVVGAPLSLAAWQRAIDTFGSVFMPAYAITECGLLYFFPPQDFNFRGPPEKTKWLSSCGKKSRDADVRVVDEEGNDIKPGQLGEVIARTNSLMKGYWNEPRITEEAIRNGYFYTGDLATVDDNGYLFLAGRKKDAITTQGKVLASTEIEGIIYLHPQVLETAVIGVPDEALGEAIKAVVVLKEGGVATEEEIIRFCQQHLPDYAVPRSVDFIGQLPKNPSGKILRYVLREKYARQPAP
jgi:acyl-CoA synthetase (AMP-forming)/AMP-acid ligase II